MATLSQNVKQAIHDFDTIKDAIEYKGVEIPEGTHTSEYAEKISEIEIGITPVGTIRILHNGTIDVTNFTEADVSVDNLRGFLYGYGDSLNATNFTIRKNYELCDYAVAGRRYIETVVCAESPFLPIIPTHCFYNCTNLKSVDLSGALECREIRDHAFARCSKLTNIISPHEYPAPPPGYLLGSYVFEGCTLLTSVDLSEAKGLDANALSGSALATVYFSYILNSLGANSLAIESLTDIYYTGTQAQWEAIPGLSGAGIGAGVMVHYEYTLEQTAL